MVKASYIVGLSFIVLLGMLATGCGPKSIEKEPGKGVDQEYMFYPALPNTPRYQYLTTFSTSKDIVKKKGKLFDFVAGEEQEKAIPIKKPYGIEVYDGIIYVCDIGAGHIKTLDLKKRSLGFIGDKGSGRLSKPSNMFIDKANRLLYVTDVARKQVLVFTLEGRFQRAYGKKGEFTGPSDVALHGDRIYICDVRAHKIHVLDRESGDVLFRIGKAGSQEGEFYHPTNMHIHGDHIYVSDTTNFRVLKLNLEGEFLDSFGEAGTLPGQFTRNKGITLDRDGRIYVVDSAFANVQVFDQEFKLLLFMLGPGAEPHHINLPAGVTIDYDSIKYFKKYISPQFEPEYLVLVTSNFGRNKVNVYAFGTYKGQN